MDPKVSVIILSWNTKEYLYRCVSSLGERLHSALYEVIVVDNASCDGSIELVREEFPSVRIIVNEENRGYAEGNNIGIREARGEYIVLLNSDIEVLENALESMADFLIKNTRYGAVAARMLSPDGSVQRCCKQFPSIATLFLFDITCNRMLRQAPPVRRYLMRHFDHLSSRDVEQPPGACFMVPRRVVQEIGVFDERFYLFFNDVDYCKRIIKRGYRIRYLFEARVMHHGGRSVVQYDSYRREWYLGRYRYFAKWHGPTGKLLARLATALTAGEESICIVFRGLMSAGSASKGVVSKELREVWNRVRFVWRDSSHG
jgi:GT2 family glycosyltransferase